MIRGVKFKLAQNSGMVLSEILKDIITENCGGYIPIDQYEIWEDQGETILEDVCYRWAEIKTMMYLWKYILFLKLQIYPKCMQPDEIHSYDDFENSQCQLLLLLHDCDNVEIYVKDEALQRVIYQRVGDLQCNNITYITDCDDMRTTMDIL